MPHRMAARYVRTHLTMAFVVGATGAVLVVLYVSLKVANHERDTTCSVLKTYIGEALKPYRNHHGKAFLTLPATQKKQTIKAEKLYRDLPC